MILTADNLYDYLLERRWVTVREVVDGDLRIVPQENRHATFQVHLQRSPGLFLKQPRRWDPTTVATFQREAFCYQLALTSDAFAPLAPLLPRLRGFDPEHQVLGVELVGDGESLESYHRQRGQFPRWIGTALGRLLGRYHRSFQRPGEDSFSLLPEQPPWILSSHRAGPLTFSGLRGRGAAPKVLELIARDPHLSEALEAQRRAWRPRTLIHGDVKLRNWVLDPTAGPEQEPLKLIDWELAGFGDGCWDVGGILHSYLVLWVLSIPADGDEADLPERMGQAEIPREALLPLLGALWKAYGSQLGGGDGANSHLTDLTDLADLLRRSVAAAGARLLQTAYEYGGADSELHPNVVLLIRLASNILARPEAAAEDLLGLTP